MGKPTYCTRESIMGAADMRSTSIQAAEVDRFAQMASREIEDRMKRHFYPKIEAVTYDLSGGGEGFWLNADLLSASSVTADGVSASYTLAPARWGPPYSFIEVDGETIVVTGTWGYCDDTAPCGALAAAITNTTATTADVTNSSKVGVGDLIKIGTERMIVTEKEQLTTGTTLDGNLTASNSETTIPVADGTAIKTGEMILIDSEKMLVTEITANNLTVRRAWDGTTLAAHTSGVTVYAPRRLTVERGAVGSTAATHAEADAVTRNVPPAPIVALCIAEAVVGLSQEHSGFARTIGSGEAEREASGKGLIDIRKSTKFYQRLRVGAI